MLLVDGLLRRYSKAPPSRKEIVRLLLSLRDVPLQSHDSCAGAGTTLRDKDLGDYLSGWLSEIQRHSGENWVDTSVKSGMTAQGQPGWLCVVMFRHLDGDDRWGWGVSFFVRGSDRRPVQNSLRCLGAG